MQFVFFVSNLDHRSVHRDIGGTGHGRTGAMRRCKVDLYVLHPPRVGALEYRK